jgi:serine protease AprX
VSGPAVALRRARALRGVVSAHPNRRIAFELHESSPLVYGGEPARRAAWSSGLDGRGQTIAVVDSGVDGLHPDLRARVKRNVKIVGTDGIATQRRFAQPIECPVACTTDTSGGHGTHVAGIAVGDGTASGGFHTGVAPGAQVVGISVGDTAGIFHGLAAFDYLLAHRELGVVAVNNSWGITGGATFDAGDPVNVATKALSTRASRWSSARATTGRAPSSRPRARRTAPRRRRRGHAR